MTFSDLWVDDLTGGTTLHQEGYLTGPAVELSTVLLEFIKATRAMVNLDHNFVADVEMTITGDQLVEAFVETEKRSGITLTEADGRRSVDCVNPDHTYRCWFVES